MPTNVARSTLAVFLFASALAACGGGGGSSSGGPIPVATATATTLQPQTTTLTGVAGVTSGSVTVQANAVVTVTASTTSPTGVAGKRRAIDGLTPLLYLAVTSSGTATISALSSTITFTSTPGMPLSLYVWQNSTWTATSATVTASGSTISFSTSFAGGVTTPADFAIYSGVPASASPGASPTPTAIPSATPTSSPTAAPTATASAGPTTAPDSCMQTPDPSFQSGGVSSAEGSFFTALGAAGTGSQVCLSVWEPSSQLETALVTAATNHAAVTVIFPVAEHSADSSYASTLAALGARVIWDDDSTDTYATPSPLPTGEFVVTPTLPFHAKFAFVNGVAYMDGHNWFSTDVILQDQNAADYTAMQSDLTNFPSTPPSVSATQFTTDKYNSLNAEAALITGANPGTGTTVDFISEDFEDYGAPAEAVYGALTAAAQNGATVNVIVEGPVTAGSYEACDLNTLASYGATIRLGSSGSEKVLLIGPSGSTPTTAWMGSSNMSDYDYIDWGMNVSGTPSVVSALQAYYANALSAPLFSTSAPNGCSL